MPLNPRNGTCMGHNCLKYKIHDCDKKLRQRLTNERVTSERNVALL